MKVRNIFKVFEAQPCTGRSQWAEDEDMKFFEIGKCLPLPLGDLRKIYLTCYCNKKYMFFVDNYLIVTNENRIESNLNII